MHAEELDHFEGAPRASATSPPEALYVAARAAQSLHDFKADRHWNRTELLQLERALRHTALVATPTRRDMEVRLAVIHRLRTLARSGINFCTGLDLSGFGSFVSGLYTPNGDLDLSIEGTALW